MIHLAGEIVNPFFKAAEKNRPEVIRTVILILIFVRNDSKKAGTKPLSDEVLHLPL